LFAKQGEREAHNGLGVMYRDGLGVKQDIKKAFVHFTHAAGQALAEAQVNLAKIHLARNEVHLATNLLHQAARSGSPFEAYYHLGMLYATAARGSLAAGARPETCGVAIAHLKQAAERGCWDEDFGGWLEADRNWERGETDKAILGWWMAGERGVESAQNNLAFLLDQGRSRRRSAGRCYVDR
jgi:SEL1 protein